MSDDRVEQGKPAEIEINNGAEKASISIEDVYAFAYDAVERLASGVKADQGEDAWSELAEALIKGRPQERWAQELVVARHIAHSLKGSKLSEKPLDEQLQNARILTSVFNVNSASMIHNLSEHEKRERYDESVDGIFDLLEGYQNEMNFEEYQYTMLWHSQYLAAHLPANSASPKEANKLLHDLDMRLKKRQPVSDEFYLGYNLLYERLAECGGDIPKIIETAKYITEGLEDEALTAAKLFFSDTMLSRLQAYVKEYATNESYREKLITAWATIDRIVDGKNYLEAEIEQVPSESVAETEVVELETFKPMEVKWEVLPPGELLDHAKEIAEEMMEQAGEHTPPVIDPLRLRTLEKVREEWGTDSAYYMKGALKRRHTVRDGQKECPDQYIVLILQEKGADGNIVEHAVAESPIAGPHAMYVYRQDVNPEVSWREVMSLNKADARKLGARPLKHPSGLENGELVATMAERTGILLAATPEEFLRVEFNGSRIRISQKLAIKAFAHLSTS